MPLGVHCRVSLCEAPGMVSSRSALGSWKAMSCRGSSLNTRSLYYPIMSPSRAAGKCVGMETDGHIFYKAPCHLRQFSKGILGQFVSYEG